MTFTALHRAAGAPPGPLTDAILDAAVEQGAVESDSLDWKLKLPPQKGLKDTDFPKDVAAMANSGGGVIVYGVQENEKAATSRVDVDELTEGHERTLRSVAVTAISPPLFNLRIHRLGEEMRAVVVEVPPSLDAPHLIYRGETFGAPVRNDADTVWMQERDLAELYRRRFDARRARVDALDHLYEANALGCPTAERAYLVAVARPHFPEPARRMTVEGARAIAGSARSLLKQLAPDYPGQMEWADFANLRTGLRRWIALPARSPRLVAPGSASIHFDGTVSVVKAVGGMPYASGKTRAPHEVDSASIEEGVAELTALARAAALESGRNDYDVRIGVEWSGTEALLIETIDNFNGRYDAASVPLRRYMPVAATVDASGDLDTYRRQALDVALDCINQGGVRNPRRFAHPEE